MCSRLLGTLTCCLVVVSACAPAERIAELRLNPSPATRLLVIAPHPDDEAIAAAGLIQRVVSAGGRVRVVLMTSGDAFVPALQKTEQQRDVDAQDLRRFGRLREQESERAMTSLGLGSDDVTFLGFPDEGVCLLASAYLSAQSPPLVSPYTARDNPPRDEQIVRGVEYRGVDVRTEVERILRAFRPTVIVLPDPEDDHPDHCASYIFGSAALERNARAQNSRPPTVLRYVVHSKNWPDRDRAPRTLTPPEHFEQPQTDWRTLTLTAAEARAKAHALSMYDSQAGVVGDLLRAFSRTNELFLEGEPSHHAECWCDAEHVATDLPPAQRRRHPRWARP
jgi:LmbE family N-acetylglucosaminyl deacetylase